MEILKKIGFWLLALLGAVAAFFYVKGSGKSVRYQENERQIDESKKEIERLEEQVEIVHGELAQAFKDRQEALKAYENVKARYNNDHK